MQSYGFVPGGTIFELAAAAYVGRRKNTTILSQASGIVPLPLADLHNFIAEGASGAQTVLPVQDLYLVSHGTHIGAMALQLDATRTGLSFEEVVDVASAGTIRIPLNVVDPRPTTGGGLPVPCVVHIVGCFIGAFDPYVRRFRQALGGGALGVSAPKGWDTFYVKPDGTAILKGALRFMLYDFRVASPDPFVSRDELIQAFEQQPYRRIDGSVVPHALWGKAVPRDFDVYGRRGITNRVGLKPAIQGQKRIGVFGRYENTYEKVGPYSFPGGPGLLSLPATRRAFILSQLQTNPQYQAGHALPVYQRFGFTTLADFVNGYNWLPTNVPLVHSSDQWIGYRRLYMCGVPIVDPSNDDQNLVCDYVSADGAVERLDLTNDPNLFARVFA